MGHASRLWRGGVDDKGYLCPPTEVGSVATVHRDGSSRRQWEGQRGDRLLRPIGTAERVAVSLQERNKWLGIVGCRTLHLVDGREGRSPSGGWVTPWWRSSKQAIVPYLCHLSGQPKSQRAESGVEAQRMSGQQMRWDTDCSSTLRLERVSARVCS